MAVRWQAVLLALGLVSCGPRRPGAVPGEMLFWRVTQSEVSFSNCTDDAAFREQLQPVAFDENTYLIYRIADDGKTATPMSCATIDRASCKPSESGIVFSVAASELSFMEMVESPLGNGGCRLQALQNWVLTDLGEKLSMEVSNVLGLAGDEAACEQVEKQIAGGSPNKTGVQGCVVRFDIKAQLD